MYVERYTWYLLYFYLYLDTISPEAYRIDSLYPLRVGIANAWHAFWGVNFAYLITGDYYYLDSEDGTKSSYPPSLYY